MARCPVPPELAEWQPVARLADRVAALLPQTCARRDAGAPWLPRRMGSLDPWTNGQAGRVLLGEAERVGADLVAAAAHGWRGVDLVLGSVAGRVLRQSACPVLTFRRASLRGDGAM